MSVLPGFERPAPSVAADGAMGDEFYTPRWLLELVGDVTVDPCWSPDSCVRPDRAIDVRSGRDGLVERWIETPFDVAFANFPFSNGAAWLAKGAAEGARCEQMRGGVVVLLGPAYPGDGPWARHVWPSVRAVGYLDGRIEFHRPDGTLEQKGRGHALMVFGDVESTKRWVREFRRRDRRGRVTWTAPI